MTELHELEQKRQDRIPHGRHISDSDVLAERKLGDTLPVVSTDGALIGQFDKASRQIARGYSKFDGVIFPFDIHTDRRGKVTVGRNARYYFEDEEIHIRVKHGRIDEDGRIYVDLQETAMTFPRRTWTMTTENMARLIEEGRLKSDKEIHENAMEALEGYPVE